MTEHGTLRRDGERRAVSFERVYEARPEELWRSLTTPEQLGGWLAEVVRWELEENGAFELRFGAEDTERASGRVRRLEEGRLLELDWQFPGEPQSLVRFEVRPHERGAVLALEHVLLDAESAPAYSAGWHAHLDRLAAHLRGDTVDWLARYQELRPSYDEQASALS